MTTQTTTPETVVANAIKEISHIATLPEITLKIIELVEDPSSTAQHLHNVISNDPALCSRILKVVNSSFYGLPGQIGSINRAIVLLGLNAVKNIAISASMAKLFRGGQLCPSFNAKDLWKHSICTGVVCKLIADEIKLGSGDEAFLAGLMHDLGMMVEMQFNRNALTEVCAQTGPNASSAPTADMREVERKVFGADHQMFGKALAEKWKFPRNFAIVCGNHHNPLELPTDSRTMACVVHVADRIAGGAKGGFRLDLPSLEPEAGAMEHLKLNAAAIERINGKLAGELDSVESMLS